MAGFWQTLRKALVALAEPLRRPGAVSRPPPGPRKLAVPYISQFDSTASHSHADCGPTCVAMLLNAGQPVEKHVTVDELYARAAAAGQALGLGYLSRQNLLDVAARAGVYGERRQFSHATALKHVRTLLDDHRPFIALIHYGAWVHLTKASTFTGGHFVLVTGYDDTYIYIHDPLFSGMRRDDGAYFPLTYADFLRGWSEAHLDKNHNFSAAVFNKRVEALDTPPLSR